MMRGPRLLIDHEPAAPEALWQAVGDLKAEAKIAEAAQLEDQIIASYPSSEAAPRAAFDRGWAAYAKNDDVVARQIWESVRQRWPTTPSSDARRG